MTEIIGVRTPLTALANKGQIPIARGLLAGGEPCFTHLGSDPYWRVGVNWHPRPGCAPGGAVTFFCVAKRKSPKKRPPPLPAPRRSRVGEPAVLAPRGHAANSLRSNMRPTDPRGAALLGALQRGTPGSGISGAPRRIAPRARNNSGAPIAIHSDVTTRTTTPISRPRRDARLRRADPAPGVPLCMRRGAQLWADQGPRLSEPQASSSGTPLGASTAGSPARERRGAGSGGAFLLVTFGVHVTLLRKVSEPRVQSTPLRKRKPASRVSVKVTAPPGAHPGRPCP